MIKCSQYRYQKQIRQNKHTKDLNLLDAFRESPQQIGKKILIKLNVAQNGIKMARDQSIEIEIYSYVEDLLSRWSK